MNKMGDWCRPRCLYNPIRSTDKGLVIMEKRCDQLPDAEGGVFSPVSFVWSATRTIPWMVGSGRYEHLPGDSVRTDPFAKNLYSRL